jgi:putative addiction module component (TIGR02574 family)
MSGGAIRVLRCLSAVAVSRMIAEQIPALTGLNLQEKWQLAVELWDEVDALQEQLPTDDALLKIVEQRFADYDRDPSTAMTLEEFKLKFRLP